VSETHDGSRKALVNLPDSGFLGPKQEICFAISVHVFDEQGPEVISDGDIIDRISGTSSKSQQVDTAHGEVGATITVEIRTYRLSCSVRKTDGLRPPIDATKDMKGGVPISPDSRIGTAITIKVADTRLVASESELESIHP